MGQLEQDDLTTGKTLQMVQLNTLGQLERGHLERGVLNVAPFKAKCGGTADVGGEGTAQQGAEGGRGNVGPSLAKGILL